MNDVIDEDNVKQMTSNETDKSEHWLEQASKKNLLFSAIALGSLLGTFPLIHIMQRFGTRISFTAYGLLSTIATLLLPLSVDFGGFWAVALIRVLQGAAIAINYPLLGSISEAWSPLDQSSFYIAILSCHLQFAAMMAMPVSGVLCDSTLGWRSVYYLMGLISLLFFVIYFKYYKNNPAMHRKVSVRELSHIQAGKEIRKEREAVPYKAIMTTPAIIGFLSSSIGGNLGFQLFFQYGPIYMNQAMGMEVASTGLATAFPYFLSFLVKFIAGPLSDRTTFIGETAKIVLFTSISQGIMAACILGLAWTEQLSWAQVLYTIAIAASGLNIVGVIRCAQLVARQHVHFVMAVVTLTNSFLVLLIPVFVAIIAPNNSVEEWSRVFYTVTAVVILSNLYFLFKADSKPAEWTKADWGKAKDAFATKKPPIITVTPGKTDKIYAYGFHVHNCVVRDSFNGIEHQIIDRHGCSTDLQILTHPHYDTYHDQAAAKLWAFKVG
ncbi:unnamed protein product, partial [Mesorhabditis belari]|uniref:Major facilitator superfamily (MFS) profile domain-containing protein n=1 Tax=Mesorhabditis belari TaxID=2138241 RepID=A0AAF3F1N7_9BILA